jgi:flavin reductase (DIM6/NTAB) family NADH-FMN oxidoreductase RutF
MPTDALRRAAGLAGALRIGTGGRRGRLASIQEESTMVSADTFRSGMRRLAAGVSLVTCRESGVRNGLTATAVMSLTAEPPRLAIAVNRSASAFEPLQRAGAFAVNVLREDQAHLAARFSGPLKGEARFDSGDWSFLTTGAPVLDDAQAVFDCVVEQRFDVGTHAVLVGAVHAVRVAADNRPLLYLDGDWAGLVRLAHEAGDAR